MSSYTTALSVHRQGLRFAAAVVAWVLGVSGAAVLAPAFWAAIVVALVALILLRPIVAEAYRRAFAELALGLLMSVLLLETVIRLTVGGPAALLDPVGYAPSPLIREIIRPSSDPALIYELPPNETRLHYGRALVTNSRGFRGPEWKARTPSVERLVLAFGSSITFGAGLDWQEAYPAVLERALRERGADAEVRNLAVPGYSTRQIFRLAEQLTRTSRPDVVIVEVSPARLRDPAEPIVIDGEARPGQHPSARSVSFAIGALAPPSGIAARLRDMLRSATSIVRAPSAEASADVAEAVDRDLADLAALGRRSGFILHVLIPRPMTSFATGDLDASRRQQLADLVRSLGGHVVDTYPLFRPGEFADDFVVFPGNAHPNARAHARMAVALLPGVLSDLAR